MSRVPSIKRGFTLVELIIVIVIIGILAAVAVPQFTSLNDKAQLSADKATAAALGAAATSYFAQNGTKATCDDNATTGVGKLVAPNVAAASLKATDAAIVAPANCGFVGTDASATVHAFVIPGP